MPDDSELYQAWVSWSSRVIAAPLREELVLAAAESGLSFQKYVQEVLECAAASRRLHKVDTPQRPIRVQGYQLQIPGSEKDSDFPFPAETFTVTVGPRHV